MVSILTVILGERVQNDQIPLHVFVTGRGCNYGSGGCDGIAFTLTEILEERVQNGQIPVHDFVIG